MRTPQATARIWRLTAGGLGVGVVGLAAWLWWPTATPVETAPPGPEDPRVAYAGPFRNVRPEVKYVGDAACAGCHADISGTYAHHPMGRAMAPVETATPIERYGAKDHDPFRALGLWGEVRREPDRVTHREWAAGPDGQVLAEVAAPVAYAVGSGARARSYVVDRLGYLVASPACWYVAGGRWDLAPGYEARDRHFNRPVTPGCLFCHCNFAEHVEGTVNRFRPPSIRGFAVGCERCHGPGELHVAARTRGESVDGKADFTIVNPARLEPVLRQAICEQCHLQGEERVVGRSRGDWDFRPGLPLHPFLMDFVDARNGRGGEKFVSSVEEMMASRCYRESREPNKLGCTSCHDPHRQPADGAAKVAHYRARCLKCHTDQSCTLPPTTRRAKQADDSCTACHMPRTGSEVNHAAITDHTIPRVPAPPRPSKPPDTPGPDDLVPFHRALIPADDPEAARNLGLARIQMLDRGGMPKEAATRYAAAALPLLDAAVARDPADRPAVEGRAHALWLVGRSDAARAAFAAALAAQPNSETAHFGAGALALEMGKPDEARDHLEQAIRVNPYQAHYHHELARAWLRLGRPDRTAAECREALTLDPFRAATRSLLVLAYLAGGRGGQAETEFRVLRKLTRADKQADLDRWYRDEKDRPARPAGP
jgi:predicted CXXCH cytochrome family protein